MLDFEDTHDKKQDVKKKKYIEAPTRTSFILTAGLKKNVHVIVFVGNSVATHTYTHTYTHTCTHAHTAVK